MAEDIQDFDRQLTEAQRQNNNATVSVFRQDNRPDFLFCLSRHLDHRRVPYTKSILETTGETDVIYIS